MESEKTWPITKYRHRPIYESGIPPFFSNSKDRAKKNVSTNPLVIDGKTQLIVYLGNSE